MDRQPRGRHVAGLALPPQGWPWLLWPALIPLWALAGPRQAVRPAPPGSEPGLWGLAAVLVSHRWLLWLHPLTWIGVPVTPQPARLRCDLVGLWAGGGAAGDGLGGR